MPIVAVEVVTGADEPMAQNIAQSLADAIGGALKSPPGQTWVRVRSIARDQYAENGVSLDPAELPVFVTILKRQALQRAEFEREVAALASAIAQTVGRSHLRAYRVRARRSGPPCVRRRAHSMSMLPNLSLNPDASPAALTRRPLGAG